MHNDYFDGFDSDPADCNDYSSGADVNTESAKEFTDTPSEMPDSASYKTRENTESLDVSDNSAETAEEFLLHRHSDFQNTKKTDLGGLYIPRGDVYDTESASDNCGCDGDRRDNGCGCGDGCGCDPSNALSHSSPEDETAATSDCDWDCNCHNESARARCELDDYEIISDVLGSEKQLVKLYSTALCESSEEPLRNLIRDNLAECANDQFATFEYMQKHGMYPTEQATEEKIAQAKSQFKPLCDRNCD